MRVLQLSHKPPFPPIDGGSIAINNISYGISNAGVDLKLLSINTPKHFVNTTDLPEEYLKRTNLEMIFVDTNIKITDAFFNLFTKKSYHLTRFFNTDFQDKLIEVLKDNTFDIILFESVFLSDYVDTIRKYSKAKLVIRSHNVEFLIWKRIAEKELNILKKSYLKILAHRLEREELSRIQNYDAMLCVSDKDANYFRNNGFERPCATIPIGIDVMKSLDFNQSEVNFPNLFHLGALDWIPNQEGLFWFLEEVWPLLISKYPQLQFHIAGRRPSKEILEINTPGVKVHGEIDDAAKFIKHNAIMVVPLFSGSGMRVKIIEGMMLGKAIVSTKIGAEGINCRNGHDILIADESQSFYNSLCQLIDDQNYFREITQNAVEFVQNNYSEERLTDLLLKFFKKLL